MSLISKTPKPINTSQDPALEYLNQREITTAITPTENSTKQVIYEQVTQVVTNVIQVNGPQGADGAIQFNENGSYVGDSGLQFEPTTDTLTTGKVVANTVTISGNLKLSGGYNRNFLTTDGTGNTSWADVLPSRVGNSGKFLVTNGVAESWSTISYSSFATQTDVANAVSNLVGVAPGILDTLAEIANVIGNTENAEFSIVSQLANKANISNLADVAFSGLYSDLSNLPTISTAGQTGNYEDIRNKPTIPVTIMDLGISDGTLGQVLTANGNGTYHFTTVTSGASTGNITFADNTLTGTGDVKINFTPSASPAVEFNFASNGTLTLPDAVSTLSVLDPAISGGISGVSLNGKDRAFISVNSNTFSYSWDFRAFGLTDFSSTSKPAIMFPGGGWLQEDFTDIIIDNVPVQLGSQGSITLTTKFNDMQNPAEHSWIFGRDGSLTLPVGGDIKNSSGASVLGGATYDQSLNTTDTVTFNQVAATEIRQNFSRTKSTTSIIVPGATPTVVYSAPSFYTSIKLVIAVEGQLDGDVTNVKHTQTCEATIAATYNTAAEPIISVYGIVYTSSAPLATFTVARNTLAGTIEVTAINSQTTNALDVRVHAIQFVSTYD